MSRKDTISDKRLVIQNPTPGENSFVAAYINFLRLSSYNLDKLKSQSPNGALSEDIYYAIMDQSLPTNGIKHQPLSLKAMVQQVSVELQGFDVTQTTERHKPVSNLQTLYVEWSISEPTSTDILDYQSRHHNSILAMVCCLRDDYVTYVKLQNGQWMMTCDWMTIELATDEKVFGHVVTQGKAPVLVLFEDGQGMTVSRELQQRLRQLTGAKPVNSQPGQPPEVYDKTRYYTQESSDPIIPVEQEQSSETSQRCKAVKTSNTCDNCVQLAAVVSKPVQPDANPTKAELVDAESNCSPAADVISLPQPPERQDDELFCEYCSYQNEPGFLSCRLCTKKRDIPLSQQPVDLSNAWKCRNCSTMTNLDSYICRSCGKTSQAIRKQIEMKNGRWICECNTVNSGTFCDTCYKRMPTQWTCKVCDKQNYTLTCIYCETEEPTTDIDSSGDVWPCEKCTLQNPMTKFICNGCGEWNMNVYDLIKSQEAAVTKKDWKCVKCRYVNSYYSSSCSICDRTKELTIPSTTPPVIPGGPTISTRSPVSATHHRMSNSSPITTTSPASQPPAQDLSKWVCRRCTTSNAFTSAKCSHCRLEDQDVYETILKRMVIRQPTAVSYTTPVQNRRTCIKCRR